MKLHKILDTFYLFEIQLPVKSIEYIIYMSKSLLAFFKLGPPKDRENFHSRWVPPRSERIQFYLRCRLMLSQLLSRCHRLMIAVMSTWKRDEGPRSKSEDSRVVITTCSTSFLRLWNSRGVEIWIPLSLIEKLRVRYDSDLSDPDDSGP